MYIYMTRRGKEELVFRRLKQRWGFPVPYSIYSIRRKSTGRPATKKEMCPTGSALAQETGTGRKSNLRSAFDVLDVDHDGKISRDDLRAFYAGYLPAGQTSDEDDDVIGSMMHVADANRDGFVQYDEFEKVLDSRKSNQNNNNNNNNINGRKWSLMEDVFRAMDRDGDGKVGHQDLKSYLTWAGFDVNDDDVKAMIRLGGGGHENGGTTGVSYEGLLNILAI